MSLSEVHFIKYCNFLSTASYVITVHLEREKNICTIFITKYIDTKLIISFVLFYIKLVLVEFPLFPLFISFQKTLDFPTKIQYVLNRKAKVHSKISI